MPCLCGDPTCPFCGSAQGTLSGSDHWDAPRQRAEDALNEIEACFGSTLSKDEHAARAVMEVVPDTTNCEEFASILAIVEEIIRQTFSPSN